MQVSVPFSKYYLLQKQCQNIESEKNGQYCSEQQAGERNCIKTGEQKSDKAEKYTVRAEGNEKRNGEADAVSCAAWCEIYINPDDLHAKIKNMGKDCKLAYDLQIDKQQAGNYKKIMEGLQYVSYTDYYKAAGNGRRLCTESS